MATKARAFTGLVYPDAEDLPENWKEILKNTLGMWLISPLHTPDPVEDLETGAMMSKKPHHHLMYLHGNTITPTAARSYFPGWITTPPDKYFMVSSVRNLSRYFLHLDQKEKEQFEGKPEELLTVLNGFPLDLDREITRKEKLELKKELFGLLSENGIVEYNELIDFLMSADKWELFDFATERPHMIQAYLWGVRDKFK